MFGQRKTPPGGVSPIPRPDLTLRLRSLTCLWIRNPTPLRFNGFLQCFLNSLGPGMAPRDSSAGMRARVRYTLSGVRGNERPSHRAKAPNARLRAGPPLGGGPHWAKVTYARSRPGRVPRDSRAGMWLAGSRGPRFGLLERLENVSCRYVSDHSAGARRLRGPPQRSQVGSLRPSARPVAGSP